MLYDKRWDKPEVKIETKIQPWQQVLLDAADLIEQRGWCQKAYGVGQSLCAMGALRAASGFRPRSDTWIPELEAAIFHLQIQVCNQGIVVWNDKVCRSKEQVIHTLREAATVSE